jgi:hypothetical protein
MRDNSKTRVNGAGFSSDMKRLFNNVIAAVNPRQTIGRCSLLLILALTLGPTSDAAAAEVLTGTRGQADNRAVMSFENMAHFEQLYGRTNGVPPRVIPPPMPGGETNQQPPVMGFQEAAAAQLVGPPGGFSGQPSPPPAVNFEGLDDDGRVFPPDTHGAVGHEHLMVALNRGVRIQDRNGLALSTVQLQTFWNALRVQDVFDPKVLYDPYAQRWIMTAVAERLSRNSSVLIGVSQGSNPRGRWNLYRIDADSANISWADFPSIGFNKDWIVVTVNMFPFAGAFTRTYTGVNIYAFDKQNLYTNGTGRFTRFQENSGRGFTMCPAVVQDPLHDKMYLIENDSLLRNYLISSSQLRLSTLAGPVGGETLAVGSALADTANPWGSAEPQLNFGGTLPQLGSFIGIDGGDSRVQNVVYRNGSLWATHTAWVPFDSPERAAVQWYQLTPSGSIIQAGRLEDTNGIVHYAYPSLAVNRNNDVMLGFSKFSTNDYASAAYAFRACDDPPGTFRTDQVFKAGEAPYDGFVFTNFFILRNRWGDYSATVVDPVNDTDMWTIQEYAEFPRSFFFGTWGTWWARLDVATTCSQVGFAVNEYRVREGAPPGVASVEIVNLGGFPGSIDLSVSDGTAVEGTDYSGLNSGTLTFAAGQTSTNIPVALILDDPVTNGNRTVNLTLSNPVGVNLGFLSNAVLVIEDDETVIPPNIAGEFNYSAYFTPLGAYLVTENETCLLACGDDDYIIQTPDRTVYGALVTVVRTNGNIGRVMVDYETSLGGTAIPNVDYIPVSGTLIFDHLQQSTNFVVEVFSDGLPNLDKFVRLTLSNPRAAPEEEAVRSGFLRPSLGPGSESGIFILEINHGLATIDTGGTITTNVVVNFERSYHRVDEYPRGQPGADFPCSFGGALQTTGVGSNGMRAVTFNIVTSPEGSLVSGEIRVRTSDPVAGTILVLPRHLGGSDRAEAPDGGDQVWTNPVFTDPSLGPITNYSDYISSGDEFIVRFANECRKSITILITNDSTVEFNEDLVCILWPRPNDLDVGRHIFSHATIVADDQPAGALDREWNPDGV